MQYPTLKRDKTRRFTVDALQGGCQSFISERLISDNRLGIAENVWWQDGTLRTRPAFRGKISPLATGADSIDWKFCAEDTAIGNTHGRRFLRRLYYASNDRVTIQTGVLTYDGDIIIEGQYRNVPSDTQGMIMEYPYTAEENVLIFLSDGNIYAQSSVTGEWRSVVNEAYVPCIQSDTTGVLSIFEGHNGSGKYHEGRNMLTGRFCVKYTTSYNGNAFHLPLSNLDEDEDIVIEIIYADGGAVTHTVRAFQSEADGYEINGLKAVVDRQKGMFYFLAEGGGVTGPIPGFENNMTVYASKRWSDEEKKRMASMSFSTWFGGSQAGSTSRQFISGSPLAPSRIYWSGKGQPLYFPETNYLTVGNINQAVTALGKQDGKLVIFKEREIYTLRKEDGTVSVDASDGRVGGNHIGVAAYFPLTQVHAQIGCMSPYSVCMSGDRLFWADGAGGVYTLVGNRVRAMSSSVNTVLRRYDAAAWTSASAGIYRGYYLLTVGSDVYAMRIDEKLIRRYETGAQVTGGEHMSWFCWALPPDIQLLRLFGNSNACAMLYTASGNPDADLLCAADADADIYFDENGENSLPITAKICTKAYDFGEPYTRKRVVRVYAGLHTAENTAVQFSYMYDNDSGDGHAAEVYAPCDGVFRLTPKHYRVLRFGLQMQWCGVAALDSIHILYRL